LGKIDDSRLKTQLLDITSTAGGGALPLLNLPSKAVGVTIQGISANAIERHLRRCEPPIIGRIEEDIFIMDLRTIQDDEHELIKDAFELLLENSSNS
jgi:L-seryl-tRNA(Ser) seleniumtransferase